MNTKKKLLMMTAIATGILFTSCSGDDDSGTDNGNGNGQADGIITSLDDPDFNAESLKGKIQGTVTIPAGTYVLDGPLVVQDGSELTIQPGAVFKARPGGTDVYLTVEQGAKIHAVGTAVQPIEFTSNSANPSPGDWGGVLLCGYAPISGGGEAITEVVNFIYGGDNPNDNSGTLSYIKISYSGAIINSEKEFNGLTLYGVGKGTTINNIAIFNGNDDSIEFFGGTVDVSNLLAVNAKDDLIDWTQGYTGTINNAYAIRESGFSLLSSDPRGIEADGNLDGLFPSQSGQSNPTLTGLTIVNNYTGAAIADIIKLRRGTGANISNCLIKWGEGVPATDLVDCTDSAGDAASGTSVNLTATSNIAEAPIKPGVNNATVNVTVGSTGGADVSALSWSGYSF